MKEWWTLPTKIVVFFTALATIVGAAWAFGDKTGYRPWLKLEQNEFTQKQFQTVMDQTQQNTLAIVKSQFDLLYGKKQFGELTWDEKMALCKNAQILNYTVVDDQNRQICSEDGTPVLTFKQ